MKNRIFYPKNGHFLVVKFSVYLNRRVFVMGRQFPGLLIYLKTTGLSGKQSSDLDLHYSLKPAFPNTLY